MYRVYFLDGYEITGVESVDFGHERDVKVYNGLGQGKFPIADSKDLKLWTITCEQEDDKLFGLLEGLLNSQEESRLVITSDVENISEKVLLKGYDKQEPYSGVYEVTIKFIEYKEVNVRTTDVPYIKRPGKMPTPPKSVVISKDNSAGEVAAKATKGQLVPDMFLTSFEDKFGKNTNPCLFKDGDECRIKVTTPQKGYEKFGLTASGMAHDNIENTIKSISKAFTDYRKKNEDLLIKAGGKKVW